jgi:outer membrane protein assembly factor BamB
MTMAVVGENQNLKTGNGTSNRSPIQPRLWVGVFVVLIQMFLLFVPGLLAPRSTFHFIGMMIGMLLGLLGTVVWWGMFSRTPKWDRIVPLGVFFLGAIVVGLSYYRQAIMGLILFGVPLVSTLWVGWLLLSSRMSWPLRRWGLIGVILGGWSVLALVRIDGTDADLWPQVSWRWQKTPEELFLEEKKSQTDLKVTTDTQPLVVQKGDWPEFRGPARDSKVLGTVSTDGERFSPKLLWKQRVGPGWSSFAIVGDYLYTQEQRGEEEAIVCYSASTGKEKWSSSVTARFYEVIAGAGPRATPTFHENRIYALGATGKLVCLDAVSGKEHWVRDIGEDSGAKPPQWGFSSSPLVLEKVVIVVAGGPNGKGTLGYDLESGKLLWAKGEATHSYSSAQAAIFFGVSQVLVASDYGLESFRPANGELLWKHAWEIAGMNRVTQPNIIGEGEILLSTGVGSERGTRRIRIQKNPEGWTEQTVWTSQRLKPYYNDFVTHNGYAYGFDDAIFVCIDLADGKTKWKGGRYGHGQVLLLAEQNRLLVISDEGKIVLLEATPEELRELSRFQAIQGKTWNHPVIAHGKLYVRNGEEMACFDLKEDSE